MAAPVVIQLTAYEPPPPVITPSKHFPPSTRRLMRTPSLSTITDRRESGTSFDESRRSESSASIAPSISTTSSRLRHQTTRQPTLTSSSEESVSTLNSDDEAHTASVHSHGHRQHQHLDPPPQDLLTMPHKAPPQPMPPAPLPLPRPQPPAMQPRENGRRFPFVDPDIQADLDMYDQLQAQHNRSMLSSTHAQQSSSTTSTVTPNHVDSAFFTPHDAPTEQQIRAAAALTVQDAAGTHVRFGDLFEGQRTIVIFLRHFWCPLCQDYMYGLMRAADPKALTAARVRLVIISNGAHTIIPSYRQIFRMPPSIPLFTDPTRSVYLALGMCRRTTEHGPENPRPDYVRHGYWPGIGMVVKNAIKFRMPLTANGGDIKQLGGEFILGPGLACDFVNRMETTRAHTSAERVLSAAGVTPRIQSSDASPGTSLLDGSEDTGSVDSKDRKKVVRAVRSLPARALRGDGSGNAPQRKGGLSNPPSAWTSVPEASTSTSNSHLTVSVPGTVNGKPKKKSSWSELRAKFVQIAAATTTYTPRPSAHSQLDEPAMGISSAPEPRRNHQREREWAREQMQGPSLWFPEESEEWAREHRERKMRKQREQAQRQAEKAEKAERERERKLNRSKSVGDGLNRSVSSRFSFGRRSGSAPQRADGDVTPTPGTSSSQQGTSPSQSRRFGAWAFLTGGSPNREQPLPINHTSSAPAVPTRHADASRNKNPKPVPTREANDNLQLPLMHQPDPRQLDDRDRSRRLSDPGPAFVAQWLAGVVSAAPPEGSDESISDEYGVIVASDTR